MAPSLEVRSATREDLEAVASLEQGCFPAPLQRPWSRSQVAAELRQDRLFLVACLDAEVVAYAIFMLAAGEAELLRVATDPGSRRRGAARELLAAGILELDRRGISACHLEVRADNTAALGLYHRHGFTPRGRRPGYYADGCDALLLGRISALPPLGA